MKNALHELDTKLEKIQFLDGTALKLIAMISMVFDHVGDTFFPEQTWMRLIGRLALPLFAFCVSEGFRYTRDRSKYLIRLGIFALVSELPFDLLTAGRLELGHQNVMLTFFLAILALIVYDKIAGRGKGVWRKILGVLAAAAFGVAAQLLGADYGFFAVGLVFVFYVSRDLGRTGQAGCSLLYQLALRNVGIYLWGAVSSLVLLCYNGKKGRGLKWLFYVFYPGHMLLLWLLKLWLARA